WFNMGVKQTPRKRDKQGRLFHLKPEEIRGPKWVYRVWPSHNYAISVCFAYDHYRKGTHVRLKKLQAENSPMLRSPFERGETFIRNFSNAFTVARMDDFAVIIHTGPVGYDDPMSGNFHHKGPYGFGGGQLSAFWTPKSGSILLGRRGGMSWDKSYDTVENWKQWPIHAVSGSTHEGKVFTSGRIVRPKVESEVEDNRATIRVSGRIPAEILGQGKVLQGRIAYERSFAIAKEGVTVTTTARAYGQDKVAELYETFPIFIPKASKKGEGPPLKIEFKANNKWSPAIAEFQEGISAIRITRYEGAIEITFKTPRRAALSPEEFKRGFITRNPMRNIMVDLLANAGQPQVFNGTKSITYTVKPIAR
ncbi:MAG: hypothetical protein QF886_15745, partial [Planctomycetota bacterium]|nr:hypothetical protein [Planctomycetota bacterium]